MSQIPANLTRLRALLATLSTHFVEKQIVGGIAFMLHNKICVGIIGNELLCRIDAALMETVLHKEGVRPMSFKKGRASKSFILVSEEVIMDDAGLRYWVGLAVGE